MDVLGILLSILYLKSLFLMIHPSFAILK